MRSHLFFHNLEISRLLLVNFLIDWFNGNVSWIYNWDPFASENDPQRPLFSKLMDNPVYKKTFTAHLRTIIEDIYNYEFIESLANSLQTHIEIHADSYPNILPELNNSDYFHYNVENYLHIPNGVYSDYCGILSTVEERREYLLSHNEINKVPPNISDLSVEIIPENEILILLEVDNASEVELMVKNQYDHNDFISILMSDDGFGADMTANDNIYSAIIQGNDYNNSIKYYFRSSNSDAMVLSPKKAQWEFYVHTFDQQNLPDSTIVINEINYNSADNHNSGDWVELHNPYDVMIDISQWQLKDEVNDHIFHIPDSTFLLSGGFIVLCNDTNNFKNRYPSVNNFIGNFDFGLSGGGELIRIFDENSFLIDSVLYDDVHPWSDNADGNGPTLELVNPHFDNSLAENWTSSMQFGTPGSINSGFLYNNKELLCDNKV